MNWSGQPTQLDGKWPSTRWATTASICASPPSSVRWTASPGPTIATGSSTAAF